MQNVDKRIIDFIHEHHIFTLASSSNNIPWCSTCFYAYIDKENMLVFTSDENTRHIAEVKENNSVAGAIALETMMVGKIRGIQFSGKIVKLEGEKLKNGMKAYLLRFPFAILKKTVLWGIQPDYIKMTDNRLGFGKKLIWKNISNRQANE